VAALAIMTSIMGKCQKPDRQGGPLSFQALPDGRASDTRSGYSLCAFRRP
jgi:hypothetical protein